MVWIPLTELRNYYLLECQTRDSRTGNTLDMHTLFYGTKNGFKPTTSSLTGWIKYWRRARQKHIIIYKDANNNNI